MFDYRYHALSLAAVLLALALGVLIGVAIGDSNLVSSAKSGIVHDLDSEVSEARHQVGQLQQKLSDEEAFVSDLYPMAVHGLLNGRSDRAGVLRRRPPITSTRWCATAVTQAGGRSLDGVAVREPLDLAAIGREAAGTHYAGARELDPTLVERFGQLVGRQLVSGGQLVDRELLSRVRGSLLSAFDGQLGQSRRARRDARGPNRDEPGSDRSVRGVRVRHARRCRRCRRSDRGRGAESSEPSQVLWYKSKGISSVDDLDTTAGQTALVYALSGDRGSFGIKSTAESLLPSVTRERLCSPERVRVRR